jgi:zeaxanthin glucosyltransferase
MTHIGILCPATLGHLNPMCNLGTELLQRDHKVTLFGVPEVKERISQSALRFCEIGASEFPPNTIEEMSAQFGHLSGLEGLRFLVHCFNKEVGMLYRDAPDAIRSAGVELLLIDQATPAGGTIADFLHLPFVTVCNALPANSEPGVPPWFTHWKYKNSWWARLRNQMGNAIFEYLTRDIWNAIVCQRESWSLPPLLSREDGYSRLAQIAQIPQELDFPRAKIVPWFHYVGPLKSLSDIELVGLNKQSFPFEALSDKRMIYATLGTLQSHNWKIFDFIAEACMDIDAQLIISLGNPKADPAMTNFPGNPLVAAFPPHQKLINRADLVVTHAGSTAVSCLSSGVPMVAIPIAADQAAMAARVAQAGAAEVVPLSRLNVARLKKTINKVLADNVYRENAERLSSAIKQAGGVKAAADIVEKVLHTNSPVLNEHLGLSSLGSDADLAS